MFSKKAQVSSFIKIRPVRAELFHSDSRTDGETDMTKLTVAFHNFAKTTKKLRKRKANLQPSGYKSATLAPKRRKTIEKAH